MLIIKSTIVLLVLFYTNQYIISKSAENSQIISDDEVLITDFKNSQNSLLAADTFFVCKEILSRPTDKTITLHLVPAQDMDLFIDYGTDSLKFTEKTNNFQLKKDSSYAFLIENLQPDKNYFYRVSFKDKNSKNFAQRNINKFHTQRTRSSSFVFDIEADPHLDSNSIPESYALSLSNILKDNPDLLIDLGDTFMCEKLTDKSQKNITDRHLLLRSFFEKSCHSVPLFLVLGNHEGEWGTLTDNNAKNLSILTSNTRKFYFANPEPNTFYSGNTKSEDKVGLRQNYYSWEWGNALFVVLDPYWYTNPKTGWGMTLGKEQYDWFKNTLKSSNAKFKFVFCHNLVGGANKDMRGGVEAADFYEWGGKDTNGVWEFDKYRPGWDKPIHQLMVESGVSIFFHGHDHFYGYQEKDGIIYQEVPQPSNRNLTNLAAGSYGYKEGTLIPGRGYLRISVSDIETKVEYVKTLLPNEEKGQSKNGDIVHSYSVKSKQTDAENMSNEQINISVYPNPTGNNIKFEGLIPNKEFLNFELFDFRGKKVKEISKVMTENGKFSIIIDCKDSSNANLENGVYFCRIHSNEFFKVVKFIINN